MDKYISINSRFLYWPNLFFADRSSKSVRCQTHCAKLCCPWAQLLDHDNKIARGRLGDPYQLEVPLRDFPSHTASRWPAQKKDVHSPNAENFILFAPASQTLYVWFWESPTWVCTLVWFWEPPLTNVDSLSVSLKIELRTKGHTVIVSRT